MLNFNTKLITAQLKYILVFFFFSISIDTSAQVVDDLKEFFTFYPNQKAVKKDSTLYVQKFIAAPVISYSPETSLSIGSGAKYLFKFIDLGI